VPLAQVTDAALVEPAILHAAAPEGGDGRGVASKRALLLLDNMEQLLGAGPDVAEILASGPDLHVIVTSRERLDVRGEQEYEVEPLPLAEAVELFTQTARRLVPAFEPDEHVPAIAQRVDGLPLAVELAAGRTKVLSPAQIRQGLGRSLDFLTGGRDAPQRQRTLRATIEWSFELLSDAEQGSFARLAIFAVSFSVDAAEDVTGVALGTLAALVDKSLLRATGEGRFFLLETIRAFALERLAEAGEEEQLRERELRHLLRVFPPPSTGAAMTRDDHRWASRSLRRRAGQRPRNLELAARARTTRRCPRAHLPMRGFLGSSREPG
jgi:predicted ATPase